MFDRSEDDAFDEFMGSLFAIAKFLFFILWALVGGLAALLIKNMQAKPEVKLRWLGPSGHWGTLIEAVQCPACDTPNESGANICYFCGYSLRAPSAAQSEATQLPPKVLIVVALWVLFLCMFAYVVLLQTQ